MEVKRIGVVGCGLMGSGIAEVCARSGYSTIALEVNQQFLDKGMNSIKSSLEKAASKGKMSAQDKDAALGRLTGTIKAETSGRDLVLRP
jgi:3-hydroxybutyryl-CoA dehydrogenase